jgi:hypothetical protein
MIGEFCPRTDIKRGDSGGGAVFLLGHSDIVPNVRNIIGLMKFAEFAATPKPKILEMKELVPEIYRLRYRQN